MTSFFYEVKKIFFKQKGLVLLIIACIFKLLMLGSESYNVNQFTLDHYDSFSGVMSQVAGKVTPEKEAYIEAEYEKINSARVEINQLKEQYEAKEISYERFLSRMSELEELQSKEAVFSVLYNQYIYASEKPEERYLLYDNGWNALLSKERFDIPFLLLLLILITPIFCNEYETDMQGILLSSKKGRGCLARNKILLGILLAATCSVLFSVLEFAFFSVKFGLANGSFPLQSLTYFSKSPHHISLSQAYLSICGYRVLGAILLAAAIMLFAVVTKKTVLTLFVSLTFVILPYFMPVMESTKYLLPTPLPFLLGQGFFRGDEYTKQDLQSVLTFQSISGETQRTIILCALGALMIGAAYIVKKYTNTALLRRFKGRQALFCLLLTGMLCNLYGCGNIEKPQEHTEVQYNMIMNRNSAASSDYLITLGQAFLMENKKTHQTEDIVRDPFVKPEQIPLRVKSVYVNGEKLYYLESSESGLAVHEVDLNSHESKTIYSESSRSSSALLGSMELNHSDAAYYEAFSAAFFLNEKDIFMNTSGSVIKIDRRTKEKKTIIESVFNDNAAFDGTRIYYINDKFQIGVYDVETSKTQFVEDVRADYFYLNNGKLFFKNMSENGQVYQVDTNTLEQKKMTDDSVNSFVCDESYLYYSNKNDGDYLYRISLSDGIKERMAEIPCQWLTIFEGYEKLYVTSFASSSTEVYAVDKITFKYDAIDYLFQ